MHRPALIATMLVAGCATTPALEPPEAPPRIITAGETADVRVRGNGRALIFPVSAPADSVWKLLPRVFEELDIPVTDVDSRERLIGSPQHVAGREVAGKRLGVFLDCGSAMTGPLTATHRVRLSLLLRLLPVDGNESRLQALVSGSASTRAGVSGGPVDCASTGRLEQLVAEILERKTGG